MTAQWKYFREGSLPLAVLQVPPESPSGCGIYEGGISGAAPK